MNYNKKSDILKKARELLTDGIKNRDSMFHTLTVSTLAKKEISSRVMVLRDHKASKRLLRFHSDFRSDKIQEYKENKICTVIGYDPSMKIQIRLAGKLKVNHKNKKTLQAWQNSQAISKKCYSVKDGSSFKTNKPAEYDFHMKDIAVENGYENFCTIKFIYHSLEFLYLQRQGHRRCKFSWNSKGEINSYWLVP